jgi:hypothetical protein
MLAASAAGRDMGDMLTYRDLLTRTLAMLALGLAAAPADARMAPNPPPSGIVVHLFGPDSLTSHILPTTPEGQSGTGGSGASGAQSGTSGVSGTAAGAAPASGQATAPESSPSWSDIAHQMFVTGDPAQEGAAALPKGKAGSH